MNSKLLECLMEIFIEGIINAPFFVIKLIIVLVNMSLVQLHVLEHKWFRVWLKNLL